MTMTNKINVKFVEIERPIIGRFPTLKEMEECRNIKILIINDKENQC